jgi:hypothetical protein
VRRCVQCIHCSIILPTPHTCRSHRILQAMLGCSALEIVSGARPLFRRHLSKGLGPGRSLSGAQQGGEEVVEVEAVIENVFLKHVLRSARREKQ